MNRAQRNFRNGTRVHIHSMSSVPVVLQSSLSTLIDCVLMVWLPRNGTQTNKKKIHANNTYSSTFTFELGIQKPTYMPESERRYNMLRFDELLCEDRL